MSVNPDEVGKNIRRNVVSNYFALAIRLSRGLVGFRLLYEALTPEEFGYWALLWSIFGYGVLLDFGFGITVQKTVAQLTAHKKWDELNRSLSTIFILYIGIGCSLTVAGFLGADAWMRWVEVSAGSRDSFGGIFTLFIGFMGLMFPLAMFPEILRAQQRISLVNLLNASSSVLGLGMVFVALWLDWTFFQIVLIALCETMLPPIVAVFLAFAKTPTLRLSPRYFSRQELGRAASFSVVAYFLMLSYTIMTKTSLLVISTMLSVQAGALYQPGARLAETFLVAIRQLADVVQPAAAHLYAKRDQAAIRELLRNGVRFSALLATPAYLLMAFYMPVFLELLTGSSELGSDVFWVGQTLVLWAYSFVTTHNVYKRIAVMGGHEKKLLWVGLVEAFGNLGLSVLFVFMGFGLVGVASATLLPTLLVGWLILWRWAADEAGLGALAFFQVTLLRTWLVCVPLLAWLVLGQRFALLTPAAGLLPFLGFLAGSGVIALGAVAGGLRAEERTFVLARLPRPLRRALRADA